MSASDHLILTDPPRTIELVLFDLAGTTVRETGASGSLVEEAFQRAFARAGISLPPGALRPHRGRDKKEAVRTLLAELDPSGSGDQEAIHGDFLAELERGLDRMKEIPGASATFAFLQDRGIKVGVGSGFPAAVVDRLVSGLGWREARLLDYAESSERLGAGRPDPVMVRDAMKRLGVTDPAHVMKVGDTVVDVLEARNAGALAVGVLTGAHSQEDLSRAGADYVLASVAEIPRLFHEVPPVAEDPRQASV